MKSTTYWHIATILFLVSLILCFCGWFIDIQATKTAIYVLSWTLNISGWLLYIIGWVNHIHGS